ncbi:hypothetical protein GCM10010329_54810 [Streptomyces spiroverticillatus]|uniref:Uncharacterized protein n=1 Tax=Streptomyces finlayi TaxID=67296 RepID=A0A918X2P5_9ACTN|nr:hypothetical protein [Streptomyces finlayi]GHA24501.1 hypothetical protein GCM10010329_54810 [Streptomyces spiroverticillatus]GHD05853.1 hypothetical protein GCM10010334_57000 [Streptomyces finlayi]
MFEILPDRGLVLPRGAGTLVFGMAERDAQWAVATLCDVRESWVCGLEWSFGAVYEGLELLVGGSHGHGLDVVDLQRAVHAPLEPAAAPVVLDGVDVLGYPQDEVQEALTGQPPYPALKLWRSHLAGAYLHRVSLSSERIRSSRGR